jgi:hypothetical protein
VALNKSQQAEADNIVADLMTASSWTSGPKSFTLQRLAKRVADLANLEDPAPDVPAVPPLSKTDSSTKPAAGPTP